MNQDKPVAIYLLIDDSGEPRYVGKTVDLKIRRNYHVKDRPWFAFMLVLEWVTTPDWKHKETAWIAYFRKLGFPLENKNNGGGGPLRPCPLTEAQRLKQSRALKGKPHSKEHNAAVSRALTGHGFSTQTLLKMSEAKMGKPSPRLGVTLSEVTRGRLREALTGRTLSQSHIDNIKRSLTGRVFSEEHKANLSVSARNRGAT